MLKIASTGSCDLAARYEIQGWIVYRETLCISWLLLEIHDGASHSAYQNRISSWRTLDLLICGVSRHQPPLRAPGFRKVEILLHIGEGVPYTAKRTSAGLLFHSKDGKDAAMSLFPDKG